MNETVLRCDKRFADMLAGGDVAPGADHLDRIAGLVANQMEVLEEMWLRADEYIDAGEDRLVVAITFGGRALLFLAATANILRLARRSTRV